VEWRCAGQSRFDLTCSRYRLGVVLEQIGGRCETRSQPSISNGYPHDGRRFASFSPPGMQVWACSDHIPVTRSVALTFDADLFHDRLGDELEGSRAFAPRLNFEQVRLCSLAGMLAAEARRPSDLGEIYGDSLVVAILVELARSGRAATRERRNHRLAPWQLRRALEYLEGHASGPVRLRDLAAMTGLSPSYFSRAFKASTGMAPHRWQLRARIGQAQRLLLDAHASIAQIAATTGFADQAHLTRVFVRMTGATPGAWQRERRTSASDAVTVRI
jgi:AraC-like DNA-binding protein